MEGWMDGGMEGGREGGMEGWREGQDDKCTSEQESIRDAYQFAVFLPCAAAQAYTHVSLPCRDCTFSKHISTWRDIGVCSCI